MASMELAVISLASLLAGFLDSIVGGGGLVLVPAMFATFPSSHPATLLGTNKGAAIWGTGMAAWQYSRRVDLRWAVLLPAAALGFAAGRCPAGGLKHPIEHNVRDRVGSQPPNRSKRAHGVIQLHGVPAFRVGAVVHAAGRGGVRR